MSISLASIMGYLDTMSEIVSVVTGIVGALIILWGFLFCVINFCKIQFKKKGVKNFISSVKEIRFVFGTYLIIGLEFMIAGNLIQTIFNPNQEQLINLGIIVVIRSIITYFLDKEFKSS